MLFLVVLLKIIALNYKLLHMLLLTIIGAIILLINIFILIKIILPKKNGYESIIDSQKELINQGVLYTEKSIEKSSQNIISSMDRSIYHLSNIQKERLEALEKRVKELTESTEKKLETIRIIVEEKLEKTLNERLGKSFETVGNQLIEVQKGLGEMQTLAQDVGGLKRVLSNVKMRGGIGEVQLNMLLENILAPDQYQRNVKTKEGSNDIVEFAIKLPGHNAKKDCIWLPVDAKFPKEFYENLQDSYDSGDISRIEKDQKNLENAIKIMSKEISEKYISPPNTTDFAILFLPFEGIYAEVVRKAALLEEIQLRYKVIITGPTTFAAILNSLQMGFRTLAIEKRSSEVWEVLGVVKNEFNKFGDLLIKAQKNIQGGLDDIDKLVGTRTRAIQRRLKEVQEISDTPEIE